MFVWGQPPVQVEQHAIDHRTRIECRATHRWDVIVLDVHVATFFVREDARVFIRERKPRQLSLKLGSSWTWPFHSRP